MTCLVERSEPLKMKSLVLTVTLFCLLTVVQAQDDLPFLSEDRNVRQGGMVDRGSWRFDCCFSLEDWSFQFLMSFQFL